MEEYIISYFNNGIHVMTDLIRFSFQMFALAFIFTPPEKNVRSILLFVGRGILLVSAIMGISVLSLREVNGLLPVIESFFLLCAFYILYPLLFYKYQSHIKVTMIISSVLAVFSINGLSYSFGSIMEEVWENHTILVLCMVNLLLVIYAAVVRFYSLEKFVGPQHFGTILISIIDAIGMITVVVTLGINFKIKIMSEYCSIIFFLTYILALGAYIAVYMMNVENAKIQQMMVERQMDQALQQQVDLTQGSIKNLRKIRHDLKNQYAYMLALLKNKEYGNLENALLELSQQKLKPDGQIDCGNVEVSAILTMEVMKARSKGMNIVTSIVVPPKLPFKNSSLLSVVSNMLDNAMDANERYHLDRDIEICMNLRQEYLYIAVFNYLPENIEREKLLSLKSSKGEDPEHGLGTKIIQEIAEYYNGYAVFDIQDDMFVCEVMLDMMKGKEYEGN